MEHILYLKHDLVKWIITLEDQRLLEELSSWRTQQQKKQKQKLRLLLLSTPPTYTEEEIIAFSKTRNWMNARNNFRHFRFN